MTQPKQRRLSNLLTVTALLLLVAGPVAAGWIGWQIADHVDHEASTATPVILAISQEERTGLQPATAGLTWADGPTLLAPAWEGLVSNVKMEPGRKVKDCQTVATVGGIKRLAIHTARPFVRLLQNNSIGQDVAALNQVLKRLKLPNSPGSKWTAQTTQGVKELRKRLGAPALSDQEIFDPSWFVWLPSKSFPISTVALTVGKPAQAVGEAIANGPKRLTAVRLVDSKSEPIVLDTEHQWVLQVYQNPAIPITSTELTDPATLKLVAKAADSEQEAITAEVRWATSMTGFRLPAAAVLTDPTGSTCVLRQTVERSDQFETVPVKVLDGGFAATYVDGALAQNDQIVTNPAQAGLERNLRCG
ncbi:MAG: hypothetical protein LBG70_04135 [Bifidobacteriaceae bacterium]|jgi:hypothetical protein|nr:hypothetical protein [Bifidobacteriaceae bacterium]